MKRTLAAFKVGDSVVVKEGVKDPDNLELEIGGWQGRVVEVGIDDENEDLPFILIQWDGRTLREMPQAYLEGSIKEGLDWSSMYLLESEVSPAVPRDTSKEAEIALEEVSRTLLDQLIPPAAREALFQYTRIRAEFNELHHQAMESLTREEVGQATKQLNLLKGDNVFLFDSESETDVLVDFALYELRRDGVPIIQCFLRDNPVPNRKRNLLPTIAGALGSLLRKSQSPGIDVTVMNEAVSQSFTSLFQVHQVYPEGVELVDLLNPKRSPCLLLDLGLISTAEPNLLIFTRLIPFGDFYITSGAARCFPAYRKEHLLTSYRNAVKKRRGHRREVERYRFFHRASRRFGLEVSYN